MFLISICAVSALCILMFSNRIVIECPNGGVGFRGQLRLTTTQRAIILFGLVLILTSTVRYGFIDTYAYKEMYILSRNDLEYVNSAPWGVEAGWLYFLYLLNYISADPKLMLFVAALIINGAYIFLCKEYSADVKWSLFIYFCLFFLDTNNGIRQYAAAAIVMLLFPLLVKKKYIMYALGIWLAYQFHESAIVCAIIALVASGSAFNIKTVAALGFGIFFIFNPNIGNELVADVFVDSKYLFYLDMEVGAGMGIMRAIIVGIIPCAFAIMYLMNCRYSRRRISREEGILLNVLFINTMFVLMGLYMQYWARFSFYTYFAPVVLMPKLVYEVVGRENYANIKLLAILCYFFFFAYNVYVNIGYGAMEDFYIDLPMFLETGGV